MPKRLQHDKLKAEKRKSMSDSDESNAETKKSSACATSSKSTVAKQKFVSFLSLDASLKDPTLQVFKNDRFVCIRDKYPKSRFHLLLVPLPVVSGGVKLLNVQDLIRLADVQDVLKEMRRLADEIVQKYCPTSELKSRIQCGFHSIQSMSPLHMHIMSNDFVSECLKTKKHWNSFTSPYFVHLDKLIEHLESVQDYFKTDKFNLNKPDVLKSYLESNLKCHICKTEINNMPNLKKHILTHV